jgi:serine/threonine protein phosphatase PrpC
MQVFPYPSSSFPTTEEKYDALRIGMAALSNRLHVAEKALAEISMGVAGIRQEVRALTARQAVVQEAIAAAQVSENARINRLEGRIAALGDRLSWTLGELQTTRDAISDLSSLSGMSERNMAKTMWMLAVGLILCILAAVSLYHLWFHTRTQKVPQQLVHASRLSPPTAGAPSVNPSACVSDPGTTSPSTHQGVATFSESLDSLSAWTLGCTSLRAHPERPKPRWDTVVATHSSNVRPENQDSGIAFVLGKHQVVILADGVGGLKHGALAARTAVDAAARSVVDSLGARRFWEALHLKDVALAAVHAASDAVTEIASELVVSDSDGLRTTLIVVIGGRSMFGWAHIGDGGGVVVHQDGSVERFLIPQKADLAVQNVLSGSLGPAMQGAPLAGESGRRPGDILLTGTDGVFDYVPETFPSDLRKAIIRYQGDLAAVAARVLTELADASDACGYLCSDNMTLAVMCSDPVPPTEKTGIATLTQPAAATVTI